MKQLDEIVGLAGQVLGNGLVGVYLHGSAVLGQLQPRSDTDVLVVSGRRLTVAERRTLVDRLLVISGRWGRPGAPRPIELTIVVQADVRPWRYPPRMEFQYGEWMRPDLELGDAPPPPTPSPDLAPLLTMVLLGNRALFGPPPAEVLDLVPRDDLIRAITAGIPGLLADLVPDTTNVLLTLARIWTTAATGTIRSKDAAADWVLPRLPEEHRAVLVRARAVYLGEEERWDDLETNLRPHVDFVVPEIGRAAAGAA